MRVVLAVATVATVVATPAPAWAKRRVVVMGFGGPGAAEAERVVVQAVAREHEVVPAREFVRARKKLKLAGMQDETVARAAEAVRADAIVVGVVTGRGKKAVLNLGVREGRTGATAITLAIAMPKGRLGAEARERIAREVPAAIAQVRPLVDETPPAPPAPEPIAAGPAEPAGAAGAREDARATRRAAPRDAGEAAADVSVGLSFVGRRMTFTFDPALPRDAQPWSYDGAPVGGATLAAEVYPMLLAGRGDGPLARVGVALAYDRVLSMHTRMSMGGAEMEFPTKRSRFGLGLRYRMKLGAPTVKAALGWNRLATSIDSGAMALDLPDVSYSYVDVGAKLHWPLAPRWAIAADARYLAVLSAGEIEDAAQYGGDAVHGLDLDAAIELTAMPRVLVRVGARYTRMGHDFDGSGPKASARDADPDQDVGGAVDVYFGGYVTAGYLF